jgi:hypothetical protein
MATDVDDSKFALFLGAGCSISSGIPSAASLVQNWLPRLKWLRDGTGDGLADWIEGVYPGYSDAVSGAFYGKVIDDLFVTAEERQREIERLTEGRDPAFGYAVLAQLLTAEPHGRHLNAVLTTNFDDLVADALYVYTNKKPLVINHDLLAGFLRVTRTRPLVVKLHGDARLSPKNTKLETGELDQAVQRVLTGLLAETGLVFIGYGGNDKSIVAMLERSALGRLLGGGLYARRRHGRLVSGAGLHLGPTPRLRRANALAIRRIWPTPPS